MSFKILLILDNAPGHPASITDVNGNINVLFLPPNTTSPIQHMDHGVFATFKSYYIRRTSMQLVKDTDGEDQMPVKEIWKNFNVKKAIDNISYAWVEIKQSCMKGVWKKIWPEVSDSHEFEPEHELSNLRHDIVDMAMSLRFEDLDQANVDELLQSHSTELTNEELLKMENDKNDEGEEPDALKHIKQLSTKQMAEFFKNIDSAIRIIEENDPNEDRSAKVARQIRISLISYKELYREMNNAAHQPSLDCFIKKKLKIISPQSQGLQQSKNVTIQTRQIQVIHHAIED